MLVVKVELWPGGKGDRAREIGRLGIANVSDLAALSDYVAVLSHDGIQSRRYLQGHPRSAGFEPLVAALLLDPAETAVTDGILERYGESFAAIEELMGNPSKL